MRGTTISSGPVVCPQEFLLFFLLRFYNIFYFLKNVYEFWVNCHPPISHHFCTEQTQTSFQNACRFSRTMLIHDFFKIRNFIPTMLR